MYSKTAPRNEKGLVHASQSTTVLWDKIFRGKKDWTEFLGGEKRPTEKKITVFQPRAPVMKKKSSGASSSTQLFHISIITRSLQNFRLKKGDWAGIALQFC